MPFSRDFAKLCAPAAFVALFAGREARAELLIETEGIYNLSSLKAEQAYSGTDVFGGFFAGATIGKAPAFAIGFRGNYIKKSIAAADDTSSASISGMEWGPQLGMLLGKSGAWHVNASYHVYVSGTITETSTALGSITGKGYQASVGYAPAITDKLSIGVNLVYRAMSISKLNTPSDTVQTVTYSSSGFMPTLFLSMRLGGRERFFIQKKSAGSRRNRRLVPIQGNLSP